VKADAATGGLFKEPRTAPAARTVAGYHSSCSRNPNDWRNMTTFDPRPFIERASWTFASSVADKANWKHEYAVEAKHADDPDFRRFADLIESEGYVARFEGIKYRYLRVDDCLFWTSRSLWTPGQNLNRRPFADVEGQPEHEQATLPGMAEAR